LRKGAARWLRVCWAAPCSVVGLAFAVVLVGFGGRARRVRGTIEVAWRPSVHSCGPVAQQLTFRAITFGHVILGVTAEELARMREHERVHVRQYERWGPVFFLAYPLAGAWQWLNGRDPYWDNPFEVQARAGGG
jgi:hypothetical protein